MNAQRPLNVGITCYPSVGGSGVLATSLGEELARRGHEVHFISYERPFRLAANTPGIHFHPVVINDYELFKYPDYTLPLSVKMAEVSREHALDILHVHYAVPHATAAILARDMLPAAQAPKVVTTLHGTDTTLLGRDPGYGPAIQHALIRSDAVTAVSQFLDQETHRLLPLQRPIEVIHNFFAPRPTTRTREQVRAGLGLRDDEALVIHVSNLRPLKRVDHLLAAMAEVQPRASFRLLILAGGDFTPFRAMVEALGLTEQVTVLEKVNETEAYLQAADLAVFTSESESFCLGILEAMWFGCPCVATAVGGIPEVVQHAESGWLVPFGDLAGLTRGVERLLGNQTERARMGAAARRRAQERFSAGRIVPSYEALYRRVIGAAAD